MNPLECYRYVIEQPRIAALIIDHGPDFIKLALAPVIDGNSCGFLATEVTDCFHQVSGCGFYSGEGQFRAQIARPFFCPFSRLMRA